MTAELIKEGEREVEREMRKELARKRREREEREQREAAGLDRDDGSGSEHQETVEEGDEIKSAARPKYAGIRAEPLFSDGRVQKVDRRHMNPGSLV